MDRARYPGQFKYESRNGFEPSLFAVPKKKVSRP